METTWRRLPARRVRCTYARLCAGCYRTHHAAIGGPGLATPLTGSAFRPSVSVGCHLRRRFRTDPLISLPARVSHELPAVAGLQARCEELAHRCAAPCPLHFPASQAVLRISLSRLSRTFGKLRWEAK